MTSKWIRVLGFFLAIIYFAAPAFATEEACITCHRKISPGQVADWESSKHSGQEITCSFCHGDSHNGAENARLAKLPDEQVCADCHEDQFKQFTKGKHSFGWTSLNAMPITHVEPDELMEGGRGCGGCHNMGIKSAAQKKEQLEKGYHYQNNSCDECHTRHSFSKKEALDPKACQQCHMGYDHPQWEMWESSKHGTRYAVKEKGKMHEKAQAPTCQFCHLPNGTHTNKTAWGFLGVRLPLPEDKEWAADRTTILKALGVLNPDTGKPTARLDVVKAIDMVRLTEKDWLDERNKMISICSNCHSEQYAREQLAMGDSIMKKADHLLAEAIDIVAALYKDHIIKKPDNYSFAYPDLLYFMQTGGGDTDKLSHIDQILFQMYMKHRMRTYQGFFHVNPDYAYWYGWAMMTEDLGAIKEMDTTMRAIHKPGK
ncbi:MAG: multiheme c-type cytochrome [Candidatus Desulfaltia sp.]|nr:multiheme c-type cytochrome [Candidatus Desulfaltia sp.]